MVDGGGRLPRAWTTSPCWTLGGGSSPAPSAWRCVGGTRPRAFAAVKAEFSCQPLSNHHRCCGACYLGMIKRWFGYAYFGLSFFFLLNEHQIFCTTVGANLLLPISLVYLYSLYNFVHYACSQKCKVCCFKMYQNQCQCPSWYISVPFNDMHDQYYE